MISTRSTAAEGIVLMSTTPVALPGVARRPSISTKLRLAPRPRSEMLAEPGVLVAVGWMSPALMPVGVFDGTNCGSLLRFCSSAAVDEFCSRPWSTVTIGLFEL